MLAERSALHLSGRSLATVLAHSLGNWVAWARHEHEDDVT